MLVAVNDRKQPDFTQLNGGVEIVTSDGRILYLSIEYPSMYEVVTYFYKNVIWLRKQLNHDIRIRREGLVLEENSGTTLYANRNDTEVLLSCRTANPEDARAFESYAIPFDEWLAAGTRAIDEFIMVFDHPAQFATDWAWLKA